MYEVKTRKKFTIFFPGVAFKIDRFACYASCFNFLGEVIMDRFTRKIKTTCDTEEINLKKYKNRNVQKNFSKSIYNREKQYKVSLHFFESYNVAEP